MLFTLQRYEFFSKSQPRHINSVVWCRCCLPYKGTNFSANHNVEWYCCGVVHDVVYPTKVRIFQQITTRLSAIVCCQSMLFTLQRYEFFSKSQLGRRSNVLHGRCCLPYKGTNFSANHNIVTLQLIADMMLFTLQRYEFFSKSQPVFAENRRRKRCCLPYKGTNFSANHNYLKIYILNVEDVVYPTKVRIIFVSSWTILQTHVSNFA